ncbi:squalene--hopene cyclase [Geomesophilobacter sediminis]|uniref:Squalene--hopene cyclase n=1 Tax=Geomesophilobacter sediminis TaxID=2798584 RepID=A0A8J7M2S4_9BACT|nr:squalene--hopene cyclase [Geomesophilobacter sediminis]MBJ6727688.1 squalene--hopene cyclase [Geomesophilobacter sediminis]
MTLPFKHPISSSLTSFNGAPVESEKESGNKHGATVHRLPASIWKSKQGKANSALDLAIERSRDFFFREQLPKGYWWAELESNVTITAEYIMLFHFLGMVDREKQRKMANYLLSKQTENGSWTIYFGGPGDLSTTVEAYFALKLSGYPAEHPAMEKARAFILEHGGIIKTRVFTKIFLALFGEFAWFGVPSMPVELTLLPNWAYFNMYEFSSWARATIIPLSIVMEKRPVKKLPPAMRVQELFVRPPRPTDYTFTKEDGILTWKNFFIGVDHLLKIYESSPIRPFKKKALARAEQWVLEHQETTGDWGGIQPAMLNAILSLATLGYPNDHPVIALGLEAMANFCIETDDELVLQSCVSPVWDTALALKALVDSGVPADHPSLIKGAQWLMDKEVRKPGDWKVKAPTLEPGGWAFEFLNDWYPDVDDSGFVMIALKGIQVKDRKSLDGAIKRGINWCLGMQSKNGGWGAFDKDNTKYLLNKIPFADLEALIDPPTSDLTGRMLELMGTFGYAKTYPAAVRAIDFLKKEQEPEGPWWGRWGVNYLYGTWSVLCGLSAIGEDPNQAYIRRAVNWIKSRQNIDGGWGETCESYHDRTLMGIGESTASQTSWALLALMAAGEAHCSTVARGIQYLLATQKEDGTWDEVNYTGTGFPKYFMIKYHIYRNCFPLMALGTFREQTGGMLE